MKKPTKRIAKDDLVTKIVKKQSATMTVGVDTRVRVVPAKNRKSVDKRPSSREILTDDE